MLSPAHEGLIVVFMVAPLCSDFVFDDAKLWGCRRYGGNGMPGWQGRAPVAGGVDDLVHAAEPPGSDGVAASHCAVSSAGGVVEGEFELVIGTVDHDVFHNILVLIIQGGVGQNWGYPKRKFIRTYTEKLLKFRSRNE
jgi:hypothetical protein